MEHDFNETEFRIPREILEPREELKPFIDLIYRMSCVQKSLYENFQDFKTCFDSFRLIAIKNDGGRIIYGDNEKYINAVSAISRTMTNVIFTAKILIEHTRNSMKKYRELGASDVCELNQKLVDENFKLDPLSQFMESLRNYVTHVGLIPCVVKRNFKYYDPNFYYCFVPDYLIFFDCDELKKWDRFKGTALKYIEDDSSNHMIYNDILCYVEKINDHQNTLITFIDRNYFDN